MATVAVPALLAVVAIAVVVIFDAVATTDAMNAADASPVLLASNFNGARFLNNTGVLLTWIEHPCSITQLCFNKRIVMLHIMYVCAMQRHERHCVRCGECEMSALVFRAYNAVTITRTPVTLRSVIPSNSCQPVSSLFGRPNSSKSKLCCSNEAKDTFVAGARR